MSTSRSDDYHTLLARHHAMQLRRHILAPGTPAAARPAAPAPDGGYPGGLSGGALADQELIMAGLPAVGPLADVIAGLYGHMFDRHPYLRSLFPADMDFQQQRLAQALVHLIENLHHPQELRAVFGRLGRDHRKLGVWPVHYEAFQTALGESLRQRAGRLWTAELEQAWMRMVAFAVDAMVGGAEDAGGEPPYWYATVAAHERRAPDLAVLRVRTSEPYPYRPGQYAAVESPLLPHAWREYSMAGAPRTDGELEFHVRLTRPGGVSEALVAGTEVGDRLRIGPPRGAMTLDAEQDGPPERDLLLVAGGTGLAPLKAILQQLAGRPEPGRRVHLFVGARHRSGLYDAAALAELSNRCPGLTVVPVVSEEPWFQGERGLVADAPARRGGWERHLAFVSGPPTMVAGTVARLREQNVPAERIRYDPVPGGYRG